MGEGREAGRKLLSRSVSENGNNKVEQSAAATQWYSSSVVGMLIYLVRVKDGGRLQGPICATSNGQNGKMTTTVQKQC